MVTKSQVKYIQSLNEKKFRNSEGVFIAEGPKLINELLAARNIEAVAVYATGEWWMLHESVKNNVPFVSFHEVSAQELERLSFLTTPHQVLGIFRQPVFPATHHLKDTLTLVLDGIQDPGNLGTILRTADWFGINTIIAGHDSADVYNPKVVQSTMGSIARINLKYAELKDFITVHNDIPVYASTLNGVPLQTFGKIREGMVLIGNESRGIKDDLVRLATHRLTIPGEGKAESLNAAVAAGIILSHIA